MGLWDERQPGEKSQAWAAFVVYRDFGSERSITKAWRKANNKSEGQSGRWEEWARKFKWVERAAAYDKHLDDIERAEREKELARLAKRRAKYEIETVQPNLEELVDLLRDAVAKHKAAPITDVERQEDREVTVGESGQIEVRTVKTRVKGMRTSGLARLADAYRATMKQAVTGVREQSDEKASSGINGLKELADAIRNSPE